MPSSMPTRMFPTSTTDTRTEARSLDGKFGLEAPVPGSAAAVYARSSDVVEVYGSATEPAS